MSRRLPAAVAVLAMTLTFAACSEEDAQKAVDRAKDRVSSAVDDADLPDVDWDKYSGEVKARLEKLADEADCSGLKRELAKAEGNDTDLTRYIKAQLRKADC